MTLSPLVRLELALASSGVRLSAGVNDAPIFRRRDAKARRVRVPLDLWLMPQENHLTLTLEPLDSAAAASKDGAGADEEDADGEGRERSAAEPGGASPGAAGPGGASPGAAGPGAAPAPLVEIAVKLLRDDQPPLCQLLWSLPAGARFEPLTLRLPFVPPALPQTRLFREARRCEPLSGDKRRELQAFGIAVHRAFAARAVDEVVELCRYRIDETARVFGDDPGDLREQARTEYRDWFAEPGYRLLPATKEQIEVTPCCEGRVFLLTGPEERDLIHAHSPDPSKASTMAVFAALVDGAWQIVR